MGILERIEEKLDRVLAGGGAPAGDAAPKAETAAQKKAREKAEAEANKPAFTAEQLRDKFIECQKVHGDVATKALIAECGFDKLAKLVADTDTWQASYDAVEAKLAEEPADGDESGL